MGTGLAEEREGSIPTRSQNGPLIGSCQNVGGKLRRQGAPLIGVPPSSTPYHRRRANHEDSSGT
jgi:hypothetical protein